MPDFSEEDIAEEEKQFANVIATFQQYASYSLAANNRRRKDVYTLPQADREALLKLGYLNKLKQVDEAIIANAQFLGEIIADSDIFGPDIGENGYEDGVGEELAGDGSQSQHQLEASRDPRVRPQGQHSHAHDHPPAPSHSHSHSHSHPHSHQHSHSHDGGPRKPHKATDGDMDKVRSTLKQFVRDWSVEGEAEREASYKPMTDALLEYYKHKTPEERKRLRVLVPGAGLGRLAWDVAKLGFSSQGNEFSHYMLLGSFLILNRTSAVDQHTIYPYAHSLSNARNRNAALRAVQIPDVLPSTLPDGIKFELIAGDFEEIYGADEDPASMVMEPTEDGIPPEPHAGLWDAIMTCFFIDTAKNVVNYLRIIHRILRPGGVWINLGPLLWHWENNATSDPSIELGLDEVLELARSIGFEISEVKTINSPYTSNKDSMLGYAYHAAFWTATKKAEPEKASGSSSTP